MNDEELIKNIIIDGWQKIQTIQNGKNNDIGLIPGKPTLIRCFLRFDNDVRLDSIFQVCGKIKFNVIPDKSFKSLGTTVIRKINDEDWSLRQENLNLSLNFEIPSEILNDLDISFQLTHLRITGNENEYDVSSKGKNSGVVEFIDTKGDYQLRVHSIGLRYKALTDNINYLPAQIEFDYMQSFLKRTFPISKLIWNETIIDADPAFEPPFRFSDNKSVQRSWKSKVNASFMQLMAIRVRNIGANMDSKIAKNNDINQLTHYYGMVSDPFGIFDGDSSDVPTIDPQPEVVSVGQAETHSGYYGAHELAHTLGRLHPGFPVDEQLREAYENDRPPFFHDKGLISQDCSSTKVNANCGHVGLDYGDGKNPMRILPGNKWYDLMTYEDNLWISSYTYDALIERIRIENKLPLSENDLKAGENNICIIGEYDVEKKRGSFRYVFQTSLNLNTAKKDDKWDNEKLEKKYENQIRVKAFYYDFKSNSEKDTKLTYYINPLLRNSNLSLTSFSTFQITVPQIIGNLRLSKLKLLKYNNLYARKLIVKPPVKLDDKPGLNKPQQRLVRSSVDNRSNNYFLTINVKKPKNQNASDVTGIQYSSDTTYTIQVKPIDLRKHMNYIESLAGKVKNRKVKNHLNEYLAENRKFSKKFDDLRRQNYIWHTIAVDVEKPKNIYLDKNLFLLDNSIFKLNFSPFEEAKVPGKPGLQQAIGTPLLEQNIDLDFAGDLIAFELRVIRKIGIEEETIIGLKGKKVYLEFLGQHPESIMKENLIESSWSGKETDFVELLRALRDSKLINLNSD